MFLDYTVGSFLWNWFHSWAGLHGMALAMITTTLVVFFTKWSTFRSVVKTVVAGSMLASVPLGLTKMGIPLSILSITVANEQTATYLSFFGTVFTIAIGVPYLFHQTLCAVSGKHSKYVGYTVQSKSYTNPKSDGITIADSNSNNGELRADCLTMDGVGVAKAENETVVPSPVSIGRSPDNDIVLDDPTVSRYHATVTFDGSTYQVKDLGSRSGTKVDGRNLSDNELSTGNTIKLGNTEIKIDGTGEYSDMFKQLNSRVGEALTVNGNAPNASDNNRTRVIATSSSQLAWLAATAGPNRGRFYQLRDGLNPIGRHASTGFSIDDPYMSRMHAVVKVDKKGMRLYDTGGSGGTRVNGTLLASKSVDSNSSIRVGTTELQLVNTDAPNALPEAALNGGTLNLKDLRGNHLGVIIVTSGPDSGKSFKVSEGDNMIGRGIDCKISLADDTVSRNHAVIRCYNGKMSIFDVVSESGTLIDGQLIEQEALKDGDVIAAGQSEFTVMAPISQGKGV